jgi:hypothetical protein
MTSVARSMNHSKNVLSYEEKYEEYFACKDMMTIPIYPERIDWR